MISYDWSCQRWGSHWYGTAAPEDDAVAAACTDATDLNSHANDEEARTEKEKEEDATNDDTNNSPAVCRQHPHPHTVMRKADDWGLVTCVIVISILIIIIIVLLCYYYVIITISISMRFMIMRGIGCRKQAAARRARRKRVHTHCPPRRTTP